MCLFTVLSFDAAMIFFLYLFLLYLLASFMSNSIILIFKKKTKSVRVWKQRTEADSVHTCRMISQSISAFDV